MKKILFISLASMGGCQRVTVNYAKLLQKNGYDCEFLLWVDGVQGDNVLFQLIPSSIHVDYLYCRLRELPLALCKYIRKHHGYDCVFTSWTIFNISLCITKLLPFNGIKHLVIRDDNMPSRHDRLIQKGLRLFGRFADLFIAQTKEMQDDMAKVYKLKKNTVVINNPLDKEFIEQCVSVPVESNQKLHGTPIYIASGRISEQKDYKTLVKAFAKVIKQMPEARLFIMGQPDGNSSYPQEVKDVIKQLGLENVITFLGFQTNPYLFIKQADVFVLSSIYEGLPNVMIEAIYLGKPVAVTTCIPYIDQVIENGRNGYKAAVGNSDELADAMMKAYDLKSKVVKADINHSEQTTISQFQRLLR